MSRYRTPGCLLAAVLGLAFPVSGHDKESTSVTWSETVSHIVAEACGSCHRTGGTAFSLMTYDEARPWAVAIRDEVLARTMPPWGAIRGFGQFRNENALSAARINLIVSWVDGGVPEGDPAAGSHEGPETATAQRRPGEMRIEGDVELEQPFILDGLWPEGEVGDTSVRITAQLPDGRIEPLLWLYEYQSRFSHPFLFEEPLELPAGSRIRGIPPALTLVLLPPEPTTLSTYSGPRFVPNRRP